MKIVLKFFCALFLLAPALSTMQVQAKEKVRVNLSEISINQDEAKSVVYNIVSRVPKYVLWWAAIYYLWKDDVKASDVGDDRVKLACTKIRSEMFKAFASVLAAKGAVQDFEDARDWLYEKLGVAC